MAAAATLAPVKALRTRLFDELKGRIKQDDEAPAWRRRGFLYSSRFVAGKDYVINLRRPVGGGAEQVLVTAAVPADVPQSLSGARFVVADGEVTRDG